VHLHLCRWCREVRGREEARRNDPGLDEDLAENVCAMVAWAVHLGTVKKWNARGVLRLKVSVGGMAIRFVAAWSTGYI
jgi:hypothetical protein